MRPPCLIRRLSHSLAPAARCTGDGPDPHFLHIPLSRKLAAPHMHTHSSCLASPSARTCPGTTVSGSFFTFPARGSEPQPILPRPPLLRVLAHVAENRPEHVLSDVGPARSHLPTLHAQFSTQTCELRCKERCLNSSSGRRTCQKQNTRPENSPVGWCWCRPLLSVVGRLTPSNSKHASSPVDLFEMSRTRDEAACAATREPRPPRRLFAQSYGISVASRLCIWLRIWGCLVSRATTPEDMIASIQRPSGSWTLGVASQVWDLQLLPEACRKCRAGADARSTACNRICGAARLHQVLIRRPSLPQPCSW